MRRDETPDERHSRQRVRAWEVARALGSTAPAVVRAMLALVIADELPHPQGDPVPPKAPGAKQVLKTAKPKSKPAKTNQEGLW